MYIIVGIRGYCPKCGAPIYSPANWNTTTSLPIIRTCSCFSEKTYIDITGSE